MEKFTLVPHSKEQQPKTIDEIDARSLEIVEEIRKREELIKSLHEELLQLSEEAETMAAKVSVIEREELAISRLQKEKEKLYHEKQQLITQANNPWDNVNAPEKRGEVGL